MNTLSLKERMKIERHAMAAQKSGDRVRNFNEVNIGYSPQIAMEEAQRCLECKDAPCSLQTVVAKYLLNEGTEGY